MRQPTSSTATPPTLASLSLRILLLGIVLLVGPAACFAPLSPQSGRIAPPGSQRLDASWQVLAHSPVQATIASENGATYETRTNAPGSVPSGSSFAIFSVFAVEIRPMVGLGRGTEAGLILGAERLGFAGRYGLMQRARGDRLDLAAGLEAAWVPFFSPGGPDIQLRLDASRRILNWEPLINMGLRFGPTSHAALAGTQSEVFEESRRLQSVVVRTPANDLRLSLALGTQLYLRRVERITSTAVEFGDRPLVFHAALVPWARLASVERDATCSNCLGDPEVSTQRTAWGIHFVAGFNLRPGRYFF